MNELFMRPDGNEDYRKFILYSFVHRDIEIKMSMYHFANDMVGYNVIQDFFESKGKLSFTNEVWRCLPILLLTNTISG